MQFPHKLEKTTLIKRYKRFLADVIHPIHGEMTVHCPNTGSMKNCWGEDWNAWILDSQNDKRKYRYTWVLSENQQGDLIGINTNFANQVVYEAILDKKIESLAGFETISKEVKYGEENSRIDIFLKNSQQQEVYVEVKSVTLLDDIANSEKKLDNRRDIKKGQGYFPDAVTTRGQKHLRELIHCVEQGHRAVLFFLVQHTGIKIVSAASHIDPDYADLFQKALDSGVEVLAYACDISDTEIRLTHQLPVAV
jgi:sugar fermentation stimulation protein A